jgi:regulatory protein
MKTKSKPEASDLRERALRLLARREHSRFELERKLAQAGFDKADIGPMLDDFGRRNWLSDQRFAETWVADHRAKAGSVKLAFELRQRGVREDIVDAVLRDQRGSELERAREVWEKKFGTQPADAADKARQMRFLQGRGFSSDVIRKTLSGVEETGS